MRMAIVMASGVLLLLSGCEGAGGGGVTINHRLAAYGVDGDGNAFALFTDILSNENVKSRSATSSGFFSSTHSGLIESPAKGKVKYEVRDGVMTINEQQYQLADGNVFLVTTESEEMVVVQPSFAFEPAGKSSEELRRELQRLADTDEILAGVSE